jgi:hypothetical protein
MKRHLKIVKDPTPIPPARPMEKRITFFGQPAKVVCDGRCSKAWGINSRPTVQISDDDDRGDARLRTLQRSTHATGALHCRGILPDHPHQL